jgi:hypothetical protein
MEPEAQSTPSPVPPPESNKLKWTIAIVPALIVGVVLFFVGVFWNKYTSGDRELDYYVTSVSGLIGKPQARPDQFEIRANRVVVDDLSTVSIALYNHSDQSFSGVPIEVVFSPGKTGTKPSLVAWTSIETPPPDGRKPDTRPTTSEPSSTALGFVIRVMNRKTNSPAWKGDFTFAGAEAPNVSVNVIREGVVSHRATVEQPPTPFSFNGWSFVQGSLVGGMILLLFGWRRTDRADRRAIAEVQEYAEQRMLNRTMQESIEVMRREIEIKANLLKSRKP